jgi:hypothetical protein
MLPWDHLKEQPNGMLNICVGKIRLIITEMYELIHLVNNQLCKRIMVSDETFNSISNY